MMERFERRRVAKLFTAHIFLSTAFCSIILSGKFVSAYEHIRDYTETGDNLRVNYYRRLLLKVDQYQR